MRSSNSYCCVSGRRSSWPPLKFWKASSVISIGHLHKISGKGSSEPWWEGTFFLTMIFLAHRLVDEFKSAAKLCSPLVFTLVSSSMLSPALSSPLSPSLSPPPTPPSTLLPFLYLHILKNQLDFFFSGTNERINTQNSEVCHSPPPAPRNVPCLICMLTYLNGIKNASLTLILSTTLFSHFFANRMGG